MKQADAASGEASDPQGEELDYGIAVDHNFSKQWQPSHVFRITIDESHISAHFSVQLQIRSRRVHHAMKSYDDGVQFTYTVLPKK